MQLLDMRAPLSFQLKQPLLFLLQAVSSRPDVVPPAYLSELEKLQDRIPPFSDADALALIESELGQPISVVFSELTSTTVAAASLGQVQASSIRRVSQSLNVGWPTCV